MKLGKRAVTLKDGREVVYWQADLGEVGARPSSNPRCLGCRARKFPTRKFKKPCACAEPRFDERMKPIRFKKLLGEVGVITAKQAQAMYADLVLARTGHSARAYADESFRPRERVTFKAAAQQLRKSLVARDVRPRTLEIFDQTLSSHLEPFFGAYELRAIDRGVLERFVAQQHGAGYLPRTIHIHVAKLRQILKYQVELGRLDRVPSAPKLIVRTTDKDKAYTTEEEFVRLWDAADSEMRLLLALGYYQGLRISECTYLRWERVNLAACTIEIAEEPKGDVPEELRFTPKSEAGRRALPLHPTVHELLELRRKTLRFSSKSAYVFPRDPRAERVLGKRALRRRAADRTRPHRLQMTWRWLMLCEKVGIKAHFRLLRRAWATACIAAGMDVKQLMHDAGWTTPQLALNIYGQVRRERPSTVIQSRPTPEQIRSMLPNPAEGREK